MDSQIQKHIDALFAGYEESPALGDFKEELAGHLDERVRSLMKKGLDEKSAFEKAAGELGDISLIADGIGKKKRQEALTEMYMKTRSYMNTRRVIAYTAAGGLLALGIIFSLLAYFASGEITAGLGSLIPFLIAPVCGFVFLGLTQETARNYPMNRGRALVYTGTAGVILFGLVIVAITFFVRADSPFAMASLGALIPFALPGSVVLAFLLLTEKSRHKPWVVEQEAAWAERARQQFADPHAEMRFGLFSGALWIFALALFAVLGFLIGFRYSCTVFLFAIAAQTLILAFMTPKSR
ncbi:MAG: permease prefix domain 1-containing protein [Gracilibacteraceae bacterium]|jgi:MFS family permease|nr:permease prefix domain 1-containing protein [Gracilibacteraceae bacterium]